VDVETITEVGEPKEVICEVAEKLNVELLVLGSHGRGVVERLIVFLYGPFRNLLKFQST
jgi:nucleotide-binding universal stress UspA family protein